MNTGVGVLAMPLHSLSSRGVLHRYHLQPENPSRLLGVDSSFAAWCENKALGSLRGDADACRRVGRAAQPHILETKGRTAAGRFDIKVISHCHEHPQAHAVGESKYSVSKTT